MKPLGSYSDLKLLYAECAGDTQSIGPCFQKVLGAEVAHAGTGLIHPHASYTRLASEDPLADIVAHLHTLDTAIQRPKNKP
jgi:hypothetical protein